MKLSDLWRWDGAIGRGPYVLWGVLLFGLKYNIDRIIVRRGAGYDWRPWDYFFGGRALKSFSEAVSSPELFCLLVAAAIPFIWCGLVLTLRRLRSLGWPGATVVLFFIPFLNTLFFLLLAILPGRSAAEDEEDAGMRFFDRLIPRSMEGSAALAVGFSVGLTVGMAALSTRFLQSYGWGLFVGLPFALGLISAMIYGYHEERTFGRTLSVAFLSVIIVGVLLFLAAIEGLVCILMAAPLALFLAFIGALIGWAIQKRPGRRPRDLPKAFLVFLSLPLLLGAERATAPEPDLIEVATVIEIDAPPERVWPFVIAFAELPPPQETLFRAGVAYPIRAEIFGEGPGAIRHCTFSTGAFVEPIEVWDAPRRLKFGVSAQPPAMKELSPWPGLQPAHVNDFLVTTSGEFLLAPLPGGRTRLTGTTWYSHRMWPAPYWRLWSDAIMHAIHRRVLEHIRRRAEAPPGSASNSQFPVPSFPKLRASKVQPRVLTDAFEDLGWKLGTSENWDLDTGILKRDTEPQ